MQQAHFLGGKSTRHLQQGVRTRLIVMIKTHWNSSLSICYQALAISYVETLQVRGLLQGCRRDPGRAEQGPSIP